MFRTIKYDLNEIIVSNYKFTFPTSESHMYADVIEC